MSLSPYRGVLLLVLVLPATAWAQPAGLEVAPTARQLEREVSLFPLMAAGALGPHGVRSTSLAHKVRVGAPGISAGEGWLYVAAGRMALELTLTVAPGAPAWVLGPVTLREAGYPEPLPVRGMELSSGAAIQPGTPSRLLAEWNTPQPADGLEYVLKVEERNGPRWLEVHRLKEGSTPTQPPSGKREQKP